MRTVLAQISHLRDDSRILKSWQRKHWPARRRRSEFVEAASMTCWTYLALWFCLETRMTGNPGHLWGNDFREVPTVDQIAKLATRMFPGKRINPDRIRRVLYEFADLGYITLHNQVREFVRGTWIAKPKVISWNKKFFLELGGKQLWKAIRLAGEAKMTQIRRRLVRHMPSLFPNAPTAKAIEDRIIDYILPNTYFSSRELHRFAHAAGVDPPPDWRVTARPHLRVR